MYKMHSLKIVPIMNLFRCKRGFKHSKKIEQLKFIYFVKGFKSSSDKFQGEEINNAELKEDEEEGEKKKYFSNHRYVDFYRDESMNVGIITFKNINKKKNIFNDFLEELKNVIEHITNIISNQESSGFYIKDFERKDNYLIRNIKNRIPYYDNKLKVLIISGESSGSNRESVRSCFLHGMDYNSFLKNDEQNNAHIANTFRYLCNTIQSLPLITISNINGECYNSGIDIILSTDFKISSEESRFGFNKTHIGLYPYGGCTQKLFRYIPLNYAKHLLLTGETISSEDAVKINLIDICMKCNEEYFINNSNTHFDNNLTKKEKFEIIKKNILNYFQDIFTYTLFKHKVNEDSFIFSLFFAFQFLFIPTNILQNIKFSIIEGMSLTDPNLYLDHDRNIFERNINAPQRAEVLDYIKRTTR
ncbi:enoyl-CoA hydratase [Plasmodium gonderi]|uniref:Enoyl-CoA hydratase n=1 Tax=Plasmodium gonderi TaxID=77519 RepID=A0A1Y1JKN1_PLAGO|nr:enoyl-CoA hydratase [Plasmodium gonderi]GAW82981.1 enoyl-CoA hydratase [Plasmodium gonderi]